MGFTPWPAFGLIRDLATFELFVVSRFRQAKACRELQAQIAREYYLESGDMDSEAEVRKHDSFCCVFLHPRRHFVAWRCQMLQEFGPEV